MPRCRGSSFREDVNSGGVENDRVCGARRRNRISCPGAGGRDRRICRFRKWARPGLATIWHGNSDWRFANLGLRWCRLCSTTKIAAGTATLAGVSADVAVSFGQQRFREKMLITHRGLSGPAILQISSYWKPAHAVAIDLAPGSDVTAALRDAQDSTKHHGDEVSVAQFLAESLREPMAGSASTRRVDKLGTRGTGATSVHKWSVIPAGTEGYDKAEVTAGGVDTNELSAKTMESRKVPGLFFIGEVVDVTGHLGGFNFQWAWASGACAGRASSVGAGVRARAV